MDFQQKKKTKKKKTRKNNNGSSLNCKNQQEALFKSLSNNQLTDSTSIFPQNALETFSYTPDEDKTFEAYDRR